MRLKRLELFGFKSFADRTTFEFGDRTLTGVVGPNGCGKSNVVDSVRWVLGEQRPTSMRGSEMTDVIFKGSTSRPALSVAEVTLVLDNGSGKLEGRGPEVSIMRRVFQSGEGEYLLDGEAVRLKDVREMLFDTGLGSRGYSVLEQGRIDAVLSANPIERRRIFEEAAGISRYRQRKAEAELRLKRVADDMARLDDLVGELSTRVRSLKIQAGKAERWVAARDEWAREKRRFYKHRLWTFGGEIRRLAEVLREMEAASHGARTERVRQEERAGSLEKERAALLAEIERQGGESSRLAGDGRALDERRAHLANRVAELEEDARQETGRAGRLEEVLAERSAEAARLREELLALRAETATLASTAEERARALREAERAEAAIRADQEAARAADLALLSDWTQAENRARSLAEARETSRLRADRARARLDAAREAHRALAGESTTLEAEAVATEEARARSDEARRELERKIEAAGRAIEVNDLERGAMEVERAKASSRIEFLLDRERDLEELSRAARAVVEEAGAASGPCAPEELCGLVADHLRTDTRHARALDAALAARGRALVARDLEAARRVAAWLKARKTGQIGLLLGAGAAAPAADGARPRDEDAGLHEGRLLDRVRATDGCGPLAEILVGDVWLAKDLDAALELAARHPRLRFVTLEGDLADAAGLLAGSGSIDQGAVGRRSSAAELATELEELSRSIASLEAARVALVAGEEALEAERAGLDVRHAQASQARADAETRLQTARARLSDLDEDRSVLEHESETAAAELSGLEADLAAVEERRLALAARRESAANDLARIERDAGERTSAREAAATAASEARVHAARATERLGGLERRDRDLEAVLAESRAEIERVRELAAEHAAEAVAAREENRLAAEASARILEERARIDESLRGLRARDEDQREAVLTARAAVERLQRELDEASAGLSERRLEQQRLSMEREEILRRAADELSESEASLVEGFEPEPELVADEVLLDALEARIAELKAQFEKLGPVNMEAMAELSEVGGRHAFLEAQRADLARAREALTSTLKTIDVESKRLFLEAFTAVRANFQKIFRQLFGGGRADVTLEENVDVLDAGVEIVARPPGRELLPIGLLSGGQRTLTALALLFAVFEARPSPFCILDEVDAALDDANVERFLSMLDGFRTSTQFIVVTHNKGTMAACQGLHGVTMETKGVSRRVTVELDEVDRFSQRPPGAPTAPTADGGGIPGETPAPADPAGSPEADGAAPSLDADTGEPLVEIVPQAPTEPVRSARKTRRREPPAEVGTRAGPRRKHAEPRWGSGRRARRRHGRILTANGACARQRRMDAPEACRAD
jgi:chromosome segregation protein